MSQNVDDEEGDSDEDSDEEDDDDDDDEQTIGEDMLSALKQFAAKFQIGSIDYEQQAECTRTLRRAFSKLLAQNAKRSVKICIVIDRRKQTDNLIVYLLPLKYSAIPNNYCNETLLYSSAQHIMYDVDNTVMMRDMRKYRRAKQDGDAKEEEREDPIYGASQSANGFMFTLSFALHDAKRARIQFWREGGGLRFWPRYMVEIWPQLFLKAELDEKYTAQYVEEKFALSVHDELFEEWYKVIAPREKK